MAHAVAPDEAALFQHHPSAAMSPDELPIQSLLPTLRETLLTRTRLVLEAPPGAGKTTQVPLALLDAPWAEPGRILLLEPRRVAARAAATFMAAQRGEPVGATVGYRIRFENRVSAATRVEVVTEGILTRLLQEDPTLDGIAAILFDEFHERHLSADLGLALALDVQASLRPDLRLVVMSATLDGQRLAAFLDAPRLTSQGRVFPVEVGHFPAQRQESVTQQTVRCVVHALAEHPGDVLVFLPGQREIQQVQRLLSDRLGAVECRTLYGDLPVAEQAALLQPAADHRQRVVLATNVAESSVTLPGVRVVIDSGLAREPRLDPNSGFSRLETVSISQASADQRSGRAGRVGPGWCYRLWPATQRLTPSRTPELHTVDLSDLALELAVWGQSELRWLDPPPTGTLAAARDLLQQLGALDTQYRPTPLGRRMAHLGTHPRLAALLLAAATPAEQALACDLAALLEGRDPLRDGSSVDDWQPRLHCLQTPLRKLDPPQTHGASLSAVTALRQAATQWRRRLGCPDTARSAAGTTDPGELLSCAYPDRIARRHEQDPNRYQLSNGRSARLAPDSRLLGHPWLVVTDLRLQDGDSRILRAAPVDEAALQRRFPQAFTETDTVVWDARQRALLARRERRFAHILLDRRPAGRPDPEHAARALADAVAELGLQVLPWTDDLSHWRRRVQCLRLWQPELNLPDLSDSALLANRDTWLLPLLQGCYRLDAVSATGLSQALMAQLDWPQRQALDTHAPERILVPAGLARPIDYTPDSGPVLAVKLQELFGLAETPRIASGRIPLTLHLLSPGGKPLQITQDLANFWNTTYAEVKKEMKGRYPRHPWPDDPWNAVATRRAKPRGT